ncbi:MAG TPA: CHAT domain-containing tetratricopeptide repeat protein, partial [Cytophagaceae bacterium]|nr:CHAT domain-containing tetratricopeptide repeat protein [Cytophagaceae bacterium]
MKKYTLLCFFLTLLTFISGFSKEINWEQTFAKIEYGYQIGDYKSGLGQLKKIEPQLKSKFGEQSLPVSRLLALEATFEVALGKFDTYKNTIDQAAKMLSSSDKSDATQYARALNQITEAYISYYEFLTAETYNLQARQLVANNKVTDRYCINRINFSYLKIRANLGYLTKVSGEFAPLMTIASESLTIPETVKDSKGKEKQVKYSKEEMLLRQKVYASMANLRGWVMIENGEYDQANLLLEENQDWIRKTIGAKEGSLAEAFYFQSLIALEKGDYYEVEKKLRKAETVALGFLQPDCELLMTIEEALIPALKELEKNKEAQIKNEEVDAKIKSYYGRKSFAYQRNNLIDTRKDILNQDWAKAEKSLEIFLSDKDLVPLDHIWRANTLITIYEVYMRNNKIEKAENCLFEAVKILKSKYGENSPMYHTIQLKVADHYTTASDQMKVAESIYANSLNNIVKKEIGHKNKDYAGYNYGEIKLYLLIDQFDKAYSIAKEMLTEADQYYSPNSVEYAVALEKYANVDIVTGKYTEADSKLEKSFKLFQEKGTSKDRLDQAHALESKAKLQILLGLFDEANTTLRKSNRLTKRAENGDIKFSNTSEEITELNIYLGKYSETEDFLNEMLKSRENKYGAFSGSLIQPLNLLGYLKFITGNYIEAEKLIERALSIAKNKFGEKSSKYAESLKLLERLFTSIGDYDKAEKIGQEVVEIARSVYGTNHIVVAESMNELALVKHFNKKQKNEIENLFNQSLKIISGSIGEKSPPYAEALENASIFYLENGYLDKALEILEKANLIWVSKLGEQNTHTARISYIKGDIFYLKKNYAEANNQFIKSKNIYATLFDNNHPSYVESLGRSAQMYYCLGDVKNSIIESEETIQKSLRYLDKIFPTLSERGKAKYWEKVRNDFEFYKTLAFTQNTAYPDMVANVYNITLKTKAILLSSSIKVRERILKSGDTTLIKTYEDWILKKENLTSVLSLNIAQKRENSIDVTKLENEIEELEKKLNASSDLFANLYEKKVVYEWKELKKVLKDDEIAFEVIPFRLYDKKFTDTIWYAIMSVSTDTKGNPDFILLKNGQQLDTKYISYYKNCIKFDIEDNFSYAIFWKPIKDLMKKEYAKIYLSLDGVYNQLNLEAIRTPDNDFILNKNNLLLLSSTRDLLARNSFKKSDKTKNASTTQYNNTIDLFGNPTYYPEQIEADKRKTPQLIGAEKEVTQLNALLNNGQWKVKLFLNDEATEDKVKKLNSPRVFHIATHGFFLVDAPVTDMLDEVTEKAVMNPLQRSGLLLKNGGYLLESGNIHEFNKEDGILTSDEAMNLGLDHTELVVLSACETGLGEV